jgi:adenosylcobyric acid synthase
VLGWRAGRVLGTTLHGLFEADGFRAAVLTGVAHRAGKTWAPGGVDFAAARLTRLDRIADTLEAHLDLGRLAALIGGGDRGRMRP